VKVPQVGGVKIGDDVEIGANTTIDRGAIDDTVLEHGVKLDNQIQVGHNVTIAPIPPSGLRGDFRQHHHRPALHDRRRRRYRRPLDDCRRCGGDGRQPGERLDQARRQLFERDAGGWRRPNGGAWWRFLRRLDAKER